MDLAYWKEVRGCYTRPSMKPGGRMYDMDPEQTISALQGDGTWKTFRGGPPRWWYEPVEIVGPDEESIAEFAQALRYQAPEIEGASIRWNIVNAGYYCTLDHQLVIELIMVLRTDWDHEREELFPSETPRVDWPLPSVSFVIRQWFDWFHERVELREERARLLGLLQGRTHRDWLNWIHRPA